MTGFAQTFVGKEFEQVKEFFSHETAVALEILGPLVKVLVADIEKHGVDIVKGSVTAALAAVVGDRASGKNPSEAGHDAVAAAEAAAVAGLAALGKDALADGETALSDSTAHAIATAAVAS